VRYRHHRRASRAFDTPQLASVVLKTLRWIADNPIVQRSTVITGLLLAFSAATLAGVGYWVSGGFDFFSADSANFDGSTGTVSSYSAGREIAVGRVPRTGPHDSSTPTLPEYTIRKTVPEVRLQFTVADERGRLVPDVAQSDIRILDDHVPVPRIQQFEKMSDLPLRIGLLLDVSDSMKRVVEQEKSVALAFLQQVLRPGSDRAFVMAFGDGVQVWQDPSSNLGELLGAVKQAREGGEATDFFDAVYSGCVDQWKNAETGLVHRVIVLISDGEDTGSRHGLADVIAAAQRNEIQIYTINVHLKKRAYPGDAILLRLADETGGTFFVANTVHEAESIFSQLQEEMRTQYYVSFRPLQEAPGYHDLQVEVRAPQKLLVHARHGYYAFSQ